MNRAVRRIPAGLVICDEQGRPVVQVMRDIGHGETLRPDHFRFADGHTPVFGELLPRCVSDLLL